MCAASAAVVGIPLLEETYHPIIRNQYLASKGIEVIKNEEKGQIALHTRPQQQPSALYILRANLSRPFILLTRSLICFMLSLFMAL